MTTERVRATQQLAQRIRRKCVEMAAQPTGCHLGGALSCADLLAVLYGEVCVAIPHTQIVLSKGHAAAALYAVLWATGRLPDDPSLEYGATGSRYTGHPNCHIPGVTFATGALGHGPSLALGVALARRARGDVAPVYVIVGDGELQEGSCWEAFQIAAAQRVTNFSVLVDANGGQNDGAVADISPLGDLAAKFSAFGFTVHVVNGHDHAALAAACASSRQKPQAIIAHTQKGYGVSAVRRSANPHYVTIDHARKMQWLRELDV